MRLLALHQAYACRHSGVCCSSDWPIPVEDHRLVLIERARANGELPIDPSAGATTLFERPVHAPADTPAVVSRTGGRCVFRTRSHRCAVHEHLGHDALPLACRQFPRVSVHDPRGVSITLSHYCPTASALIQYDGYVAYDEYDNDGGDIVINPPGFPPGGEYVGLDARDALPPLLRRDLLMDWDAWWHLEERAVATLLHHGASADGAVAMLRAVAARLGHWRPGRQPLIDAVDEAFEAKDSAPETVPAATLVKRAVATVPDPYRARAAWTAHVDTPDSVTRRFLAAHAFANWQVHGQNGGLPAWMESIETARAFLSEGAGIQQADLVLRHLSE